MFALAGSLGPLVFQDELAGRPQPLRGFHAGLGRFPAHEPTGDGQG